MITKEQARIKIIDYVRDYIINHIEALHESGEIDHETCDYLYDFFITESQDKINKDN